MSTVITALTPRKVPVQSRSAATVDALHTATIQVLTLEGLSRCTTTRVAQRAGMSVGSLYQYYPNRDALLSAVLERHLQRVADAVVDACRVLNDRPSAEMASGVVEAYLGAKFRDPQESKALYAVAGERGGPELAARSYEQMTAAIAAMLQTCPDARFDDAQVTATVALCAMAGLVRPLLDGNVSAGLQGAIASQMVRLVTAYFQTFKV